MLIGMGARLQRGSRCTACMDDLSVELNEAHRRRMCGSRPAHRARHRRRARAVDARELALVMTRANGTWRIARLATVETLR